MNSKIPIKVYMYSLHLYSTSPLTTAKYLYLQTGETGHRSPATNSLTITVKRREDAWKAPRFGLHPRHCPRRREIALTSRPIGPAWKRRYRRPMKIIRAAWDLSFINTLGARARARRPHTHAHGAAGARVCTYIRASRTAYIYICRYK